MSLAITRAAPLKADIRLAQAVSQFEADLSSDHKAVFRTQRSQTHKAPPDAQEVMRLTAQIDRETSNKIGGRRCFGPRFTNVLHAVQQFAALGDVIIGGSQNIIACGVWTLVRMTLLSLVNYSSCMEKLSALLMVAGRSAPRYQKMALLYSRSKTLQSHLSEYFIVVVRLCHQLLKATKKTVFGQMLSFLSDTQMKDYESELLRWASAIKEEASLLLAENVDDQGVRVKMMLKVSESEAYRQKLKAHCQLLDSCSTYDYETTWKELRKAGNVTLLTSTPEYGRWRSERGSSTLLWKGKLGAGKSVLLANIVDDLNLHVPASDDPVAYFFCRHDISESLSARTVVGSLARQLLRSLPPMATQTVIDVTIPNIDCERILSLLRKTLPSTFRAYFVLDGLDECDEKEGITIIRHLQALQQMFGLLVCLSFRVRAAISPWLIPSMFAASASITIPEENPDIACFISAQLERSIESAKLKVGDAAIILEIEDSLLRGSQGMFLWVALQIESLYTSRTDAAIREALADLPKDLPETFSRIVQRSGRLGKEYQIRIFKLVVAAFRPLTVEELREALSVVPGDATWNPALVLNDIYSALACCGSLITINEEALTIKLIHHSVKQFLLGGSVSSHSGSFTANSANRTMGEIIVTYLNYGVFDTSLSRTVIPILAPETSPAKIVKSLDTIPSVQALALRLLRSPRSSGYNMGKTLAEAAQKKYHSDLKDQFYFHSYANDHWLDHVMFVPVEEQALCDLVVKLITTHPSPTFIGHGPDGEENLLCWAVKSGQRVIVRALVDMGADLEACDAEGMRPLCRAAWSEQLEMVSLLIGKGASVNPAESHAILDVEETPLTLAVLRKHRRIASALLRAGADPNKGTLARVNFRIRESFKSSPIFRGPLKSVWDELQVHDNLPLVLAIAAGDGSMVKLLLDHQANLQFLSGSDELDALKYAVLYRNASIVETLMSHRGSGSGSFVHLNYLSHAIRDHDLATVKALLADGVTICTRDEKRDASDALFMAVDQNQERILRVLLEAGFRFKARDCRNGRSPLLAAMKKGNVAIFKMVLEVWEYPDMEREVREAAGIRTVDFLGLVLKKGAELNFPGNQTSATLTYAISVGCQRGVQLLLEEGANVNSADMDLRTPLSHACQRGDMVIFKDLIQVDGFDYSRRDIPDLCGRTPLSYAAQAGMEEAASHLLYSGANPNSKDNGGFTPLQYAAEAGLPRIVQLLISQGASMNPVEALYRPPLVEAAIAGSAESVRSLISQGEDVWAIDLKTGFMPLDIAENRGEDVIAGLLKEEMKKSATRWSSYLLAQPL